MTMSNLGFGDVDTFSDDDGSSGSETAMCNGGVEIVPQDADVLLGRGTKHQLHPGNMRYNGKASRVVLSVALRRNVVCCVSHDHVALHQTTALLDQNRDRYMATTSTFDKRVIIDEIVDDIVSNHGRFLKGDGNNKQWVAVSEATARLKTAHAIQYRMRRKALNEDKTTLTDVLVSQRTKDTLSSKIVLPTAAQCFSRGLQKATQECSDKCGRCDQLEAYLRCLLSTRKAPSGSSVEPTTSTRLEQNLSVADHDGAAGLESKIGREASWTTLCAPTRPVREVTVQAEEDPVDQLLKMRLNESFISLGPMDWSKSAGLNDSFTAAVEQGTIDLWSSMNLDDKTLQSLTSFSTLSIAPSLPKPNATWERSVSTGKSQTASAARAIVAVPV
jgi:hypothetical protein